MSFVKNGYKFYSLESSIIFELPPLFGLQKGDAKASHLLLHTYTLAHAHLVTLRILYSALGLVKDFVKSLDMNSESKFS